MIVLCILTEWNTVFHDESWRRFPNTSTNTESAADSTQKKISGTYVKPVTYVTKTKASPSGGKSVTYAVQTNI